MKFLQNTTLIIVALTFSFATHAQEYVRELQTNPVQQFNNIKPKSHSNNLRATLPFIDDFSTSYILPDPNKWIGAQTYINGTYPVDPPTIGVATFDGLKSNGMPYNMGGNLNPQPADTLTS